jgi:hypothetical protein
MVMDNLPPNDPNRNNNNNLLAAKEQPYDGRRRNQRNRNNINGGSTTDGEPMDIIGNLDDSPAVVVMFLVGVAAWFLRERCVC